MDFLKYGAIIVLAVTELIILILAIKTRKPFKCLFLNALCGILVIVLLNLTKKYTGVLIPVNEYTVIGSATLGIPAVIGFLVLNLIF